MVKREKNFIWKQTNEIKAMWSIYFRVKKLPIFLYNFFSDIIVHFIHKHFAIHEYVDLPKKEPYCFNVLFWQFSHHWWQTAVWYQNKVVELNCRQSSLIPYISNAQIALINSKFWMGKCVTYFFFHCIFCVTDKNR